MKKLILSAVIAATLPSTISFATAKSTDVLETYANIASHNYQDALADAKKLQKAIHVFTKNPDQATLDKAKTAWIDSRESYGQSEIFRLSNGPIDAEEGWVAEAYGALEAQLNAWPLDENMIDYTIDADGKKTSGNIIDSTGKFTPGGEDAKAVDISNISVDAITELNENGGEANVATGYHAIEFLLWGQDQDYSNFTKDSISNGAMVAGQRPVTDFTTDKSAQRRLDYLNASADKLVADLMLVNSAWDMKVDGNKGLYRAAFLGKAKDSAKNISSNDALRQVLAGMGMFMKSELANERIAVAVLTPSEEDEHSCFSDNTHRDIVTNYQGFKNALMGSYQGKKIGKSPLDALSSAEQAEIKTLMTSIEEKIASVDKVAKNEQHFDYQIQPENPQAKVIVAMKNEMRRLGDKMIIVAEKNGVSLTNEDVTDAEETKL